MLLVGPDKPFAEHQAARVKLVNEGSDELLSLDLGRLRNTHPTARFQTVSEKKAAEEQANKVNAVLAKSAGDSKARQTAMEKAEQKKAEDAHRAKVTDINKENDAIRNRK